MTVVFLIAWKDLIAKKEICSRLIVLHEGNDRYIDKLVYYVVPWLQAWQLRIGMGLGRTDTKKSDMDTL